MNNDCTDPLFFSFSNQLDFFSKFAKNSIIFILFDTFAFNITMLLVNILLNYFKYC